MGKDKVIQGVPNKLEQRNCMIKMEFSAVIIFKRVCGGHGTWKNERSGFSFQVH